MKNRLRKPQKRAVIYPQEAQRIIDAGPRAIRTLFRRIRQAFNRPKNRFIAIKDFCLFTGINEPIVQRLLVITARGCM